MKKILVAEDDLEIAQLERDYLEASDMEVTIASDGNKALNLLKTEKFDLVLLDVMMPCISGYDICRKVRDTIDIPILMVTAKTDSIDRIRGLGIGADDYITKPFDPAELVARVKAHLRRYERLTSREEDKNDCLSFGDIRIYPKSWKLTKNGEELYLPNKEFELLLFLAQNADIVFSKEQLFEQIWGYDYSGDTATVTVHINRIREKIEVDPKNPEIIETVWGAGYRFNAHE